jgi:hypothetical protein
MPSLSVNYDTSRQLRVATISQKPIFDKKEK